MGGADQGERRERGLSAGAKAGLHESHLPQLRAAGQPIGARQRLQQLEMVVALADEELRRLACRLQRREEVARLALELGRLAGAVGEDERRVERVEMALRAQSSRPFRR